MEMNTASGTIEENLERMKMSASTTFAASLFRNRKTGQVLYLEAGKDLVDTLLSFLLLPAGTIVHILSKGIQAKPADGGIASILKSLKNFSSSDLQLAKENLVLLRPAVVGCTCPSTPLKMQKALEAARILQSPLPKPGLSGDYYQCNHCSRLTKARIKGTTCETCKSKFGERDSYSRGPYSVFEKEPDRSTAYSTGFVKVNTTCIVTDNLEIMPLTTTRSMSVLSTLKVDSLADLEVNEVTVNITQILQLLQSALSSNTCLNEVFGKIE